MPLTLGRKSISVLGILLITEKLDHYDIVKYAACIKVEETMFLTKFIARSFYVCPPNLKKDIFVFLFQTFSFSHCVFLENIYFSLVTKSININCS